MKREMDKEDVVHKYNGIFLSHKDEWNDAIYSNMDGPRDCLFYFQNLFIW